MRGLTALIILGLMLAFPAQPGWAYEETEVTNGGVVRGKVTIEGGKPRPMAFNLVTIPDPVFCGRISTGTGWRLVEDFIIGPDKALKDAVVMLKDAKKGKPFNIEKVRIEAKDCDFLPFVNVLRDRDEITVVNVDPVGHDIQGYETARKRGARVLFNRPLPMNPFHRLVGLLTEKPTYLSGEPTAVAICLKPRHVHHGMVSHGLLEITTIISPIGKRWTIRRKYESQKLKRRDLILADFKGIEIDSTLGKLRPTRHPVSLPGAPHQKPAGRHTDHLVFHRQLGPFHCEFLTLYGPLRPQVRDIERIALTRER